VEDAVRSARERTTEDIKEWDAVDADDDDDGGVPFLNLGESRMDRGGEMGVRAFSGSSTNSGV
jgi:hypothetical protein